MINRKGLGDTTNESCEFKRGYTNFLPEDKYLDWDEELEGENASARGSETLDGSLPPI